MIAPLFMNSCRVLSAALERAAANRRHLFRRPAQIRTEDKAEYSAGWTIPNRPVDPLRHTVPARAASKSFQCLCFVEMYRPRSLAGTNAVRPGGWRPSFRTIRKPPHDDSVEATPQQEPPS